MTINYLTDDDLGFLNHILLQYGNDNSVLDVSELDGFLTAIVSGPHAIMPSQWFPALWGGAGNEPQWQDQTQMHRFVSLVMQHMNNIVDMLMFAPAEYEALFNQNMQSKEEILIVEEWCFGYIRGVLLGNWPVLPADMQQHLNAIALHGKEENFPLLDKLTLTEHQQTIIAIEPAAVALHQYFLAQRTPTHVQKPVKAKAKPGRNDTCYCGSDKKYKKCCGAN